MLREIIIYHADIEFVLLMMYGQGSQIGCNGFTKMFCEVVARCEALMCVIAIDSGSRNACLSAKNMRDGC